MFFVGRRLSFSRAIMFHRALQNLAVSTLIKTSRRALLASGANLPFRRRHLPRVEGTGQRWYSATAWHNPRGEVPRPRRGDPKPRSAAVVPLESLVKEGSLLCLEQIHEAGTPAEIYRALSGNTGNLTEVHVVRALARLAEIRASTAHKDRPTPPDLAKPTEGGTGRLEPRQDDEFAHLCKLALRHARGMDQKLFGTLMGAVIGLGVPQSSALVQTLLAGAEHRLNKLDCEDLSRLAGQLVLLRRADPRVSALLQAVQLLVPHRIDACTSAPPLIRLLRLLGKSLESRVVRQIASRLVAILKAKRATERDQTALDASDAVWSFHLIGYRDVQLLREAFDILLDDLECLPAAKLVLALQSSSGLRYYRPQFLERVGDLVADKVGDFTTYQLSRILQAFAFYRHLHEGILDSVAAFLVGSTFRPLDQASITSLSRILGAYATLHHTPASHCGTTLFELMSTRAEEQLENQPTLGIENAQLVTFVALLAECGSHSPKLLEAVLKRRSYEACLEDPKIVAHLQTLYNIVTIDQPEVYALVSDECGPRLGELSHALDRADSEKAGTRRSGADKFKESVARLLGVATESSGFSLTEDADISNGYTVDFLALDAEKERPPTALCLARPWQYCANAPDRLLGMERIKQRHLAAMGYTAHTISKRTWVSLESSEERVGYLSRLLGR